MWCSLSCDKFIEDLTNGQVKPDGWTYDQMSAYIKEHHLQCPSCEVVNLLTFVSSI